MTDIPFMGMPSRRILRREAAGVVGAITPWNFPLYLNLASSDRRSRPAARSC